MLAIQKVSIIHFHVCENMKPNCFYILIVIIIGLLHSQSHQRNIIIIRHYMIKLFKQQGRICSICWFRFWLLLIKSIEKVMCLNQPYLLSKLLPQLFGCYNYCSFSFSSLFSSLDQLTNICQYSRQIFICTSICEQPTYNITHPSILSQLHIWPLDLIIKLVFHTLLILYLFTITLN